MADPKDIGKAFKEKLKDFNLSESKLTWEDMEPHLPKKGRKPFPYWIGILGMLLLSLTFFKYAGNNETNSFTKNPDVLDNCDEVETKNNPLLYNREVSKTESLSPKSKINNPNLIDNTAINKKHAAGNNAKEASNLLKNSNHFNSSSTASNSFNSFNSSTAAVTASAAATSATVPSGSAASSASLYDSSNSFHTSKNNNANKKYHKAKKDSNYTADVKKPNTQALDTTKSQQLHRDLISQEKDSLLDKKLNAKKDSILISHKPKDTLVFMKPKKKPIYQKYSLTLHGTPTYNIPLKGSLISDFLASNTNRSKISLNYGLLFKAYYTPKIALRIGYNRLKLSSSIKNIPSEELLPALSDARIFVPNNQIISNSDIIDLTQKITYHEISLGLQYEISKAKFGTSLVAGSSFLILNQNNIILNSTSGKLTVGGKNQLNKIGFGIHLGSSFEYQFSKKIFFNAEPLINYRLKNASQNNLSYKNLYLTILTGVSYKF